MADLFYRVRAGGAPGARTEPVPESVDLGSGEIVRRMPHTPRREVRGVIVVQVQRSIRMKYDDVPAITVEERRLDPWTSPVPDVPPQWYRALRDPASARVVPEWGGDASCYTRIPSGVRFTGTVSGTYVRATQFHQEYECDFLPKEDDDD